MPLVQPRNRKAVWHRDREAIGFWMTSEVDPNMHVRVFVPGRSLAPLDRTKLEDTHGAFEIFDGNRDWIEGLASKHFDEQGPDEGARYEGQPIVTLHRIPEPRP